MRRDADFRFTGIAKKAGIVWLILSLGVLPALPRDAESFIPPGNWRAVESLSKGTPISVRMTSRDRIEGAFQGLNAEGIRLIVDGQERAYPRDAIAEIKQVGVPDRKLNGVLIGMGAGAVAGGVAAAATNAPFNHDEDNWGVLFVAAGIGIGAALGLIADTVIKGDKLIYRK